jgi:hypothetical protein
MRVVLAAVVLVASFLLVPAGAPAAGVGTGDVPLEARITAGLGGFVVPGRPTPIRVTLQADQLAAGELSVGFGEGSAEVTQFEIAGGASEEHWALLDVPMSNPPAVVASAQVGDRRVQLGNAAIQWDGGSHLLGVLPGLGGVPPSDLVTRVASQPIRVVPLEPALLDLGPAALAALDSLALTPADVEGLSARHRDAILGWLALGGTVYVDAPPGPLAGWPDSLQPTSTVVRAGAGTVVASGGALAEGRWAEVVVPSPSRSIQEDGLVAQSLPSLDPTMELFGIDLGRDLPGLASLLGILAAYTLLVGPLAYLGFRRRVMGRWIAIPALAVLATGALFVVGGGGGSDTTASVVDIIETGPGPAMATTRVVMSSGTGDRHVDAPAGWTARHDQTFGMVSNVQQRRRATGVEIDVPALPGGVGVVSAQGPLTFDGSLEVTATATSDGTVSGRVRNTTDVSLEAVAVFVGRGKATPVGDLEPGAEAPFEVAGTDQFQFGSDAFREAWPQRGVGGRMGFAARAPLPAGAAGQGFIGGGPGVVMECDDTGNCSPVGSDTRCEGAGCELGAGRPAALGAALRPRGVNAMPSGTVTAIGWARDLDPVLDLGAGVEVAESRTAVVGRAVPAVPGDRLVTSGSVRHLVSARTAPDGLLELVFGFDLPAEVGGRPVDPGRLRMDVPPAYNRVEVLTAVGPVLVRDEPPNQGGGPVGGPSEEIVVPPEAVLDGQVFYRVWLRPVPPQPGRDMVIYEAAP